MILEFVVTAAFLSSINCREAVKSTLDHYDCTVEEYAARHAEVSGNFRARREAFLTRVPPGGKILDIGAAHGRDALYFRDRGYNVLALVPAKKFAERLRRFGFVTVEQGVQALDLKNAYHGVWASASLVHVPYLELRTSLEGIADALLPGGVLSASFRARVGTPDSPEVDPKGRYWNRASEQAIRGMMIPLTQLKIIEGETLTQRDDYHGPNAPDFNVWVLDFAGGENSVVNRIS